MAQFSKNIDGTYTFKTHEGGGVQTWKAYHNEAGFAGRDWELWSLWSRSSTGWRLVEGDLGSRKEVVEAAVQRAKLW